MIMNDEFRQRIERDVIDYVFKISVPAAYYKEFYEVVDTFCKDYYGDVRWVMIKDLVLNAQADWKYKVLYDEIERLKEQVATKSDEPVGVDVNQEPTVKVFGSEEHDSKVGDRYE